MRSGAKLVLTFARCVPRSNLERLFVVHTPFPPFLATSFGDFNLRGNSRFFGKQLGNYSTVTNSFLTLFRAMLGDFNFSET